MIVEEWKPVLGFDNYEVSNFGGVRNTRTGSEMATSQTQHGHIKVSLMSHGTRHTVSVSRLVASAFVPPPDALSDSVVILNGNLQDLRESNLVWRPRWFAWKYVRQLKTEQPIHYLNLEVTNTTHNVVYGSVLEACLAEGLLLIDVWRSTYRGSTVYPSNCVYEITQRV